jgi:branched-chain amino acid transport system substrate-binding protein
MKSRLPDHSGWKFRPRLERASYFIMLLAGVFTALALPGCALGNGGSTTRTLSLLTVFPLTGADGALGLAMQRGVDLAVQQNASLGGGYQLTVNHVDESLGIASQVVAAAIAGGQVMGVVGPFSSESALTIEPLVERANLVTITPSATLSGLTQAKRAAEEGLDFAQLRPQNAPVAFLRLPQTSDAEGKAAADLALASSQQHGLSARSIFIVDDGSVSGKALSNAFSAELTAKGGSIAGRQSVTSAAMANPLPLVAAIVRAYPDAVFYAGNTLVGAQLRSALSLSGLPKLPLLTANPIADNPGWSDAVGAPQIAGSTTALLSTHDLSTLTDAQSFVSAYQAAYQGAAPLPQAAMAYDAAMDEIAAINTAINAGKAPTASAVLAGVTSSAYHGVTGDLSFDKNGDNTNAPPFSVYTCDTKGAWTYRASVGRT